ncbi:MAG: serine hydrolase domain-containing protein [Planctomycetaceae bacterium]
MTGTPNLQDRLPLTAQLLDRGCGRLHPGAQLYISHNGVCVVEAALGEAVAGEPLSVDHRMPWMSAGKPLTAASILQFIDQQHLTLDTRISEPIPEFACNGKADITLRHLLTHTAGLQPVPTGWPRQTWEQILERIIASKLRHSAIPGQFPAYDPQRTWFVLGEWLQRLTKLPFEHALRSRLFDPLSMPLSGFLSQLPTATNPPTALLHRCDEQTCRPEPDANRTDACAGPGSSYRAPARELGRFYEMLLNHGEYGGKRILSPELVQSMTTRQRIDQFDLTFQHTVDFGLGVMLDSNHHGAETVPYGFGRHCSPNTFGHGGAECAVAFADPEHQLVVALATNGRPGETLHQQRNRDVCSAIYQDLGLAVA